MVARRMNTSVLPHARYWVPINWPSSMPRTIWEVAAERDLLVRDHGDGPRIALAARKDKQRPTTLHAHRVVGTIGTKPLPLEHLRSWEQPPITVREVQNELERRLQSGGFVDRLAAFQLGFSVEPQESLPQFANDFLRDHLPEVHGGIAYSVECDTATYISQVSICRTLIRDDAFTGITAHAATNPTLLEGGMGMMSNDGVGGANYLMPAVSAVSPVQLGLVAHRGRGSLVVLFAKPIRSPEDRSPKSIADLHQAHYFTEPRRQLSTVIGRARDNDGLPFITWWIEKWNRVLSELLDPSTHKDDNGFFDPYLMLGRFLTHQRLLACLQSILVNTGMEEFARMELFFEALDLLEGLDGKIGSWHDLTSPSIVKRQMMRLKRELATHPAVERVVLARCELGVEALDALGSGFRDEKARPRAVDIDNGVFDFLRALRNAGHGLRGGDRSKDAIKNLSGHVARVSPDLPDLIWFHTLRMLCFASWR